MAVLAVAGYSIFAHRYVIEAKAWHWKHGYTTTIERYVVPVPEGWVLLAHEPTSLTMANTSPSVRPRDWQFHAAAIVTVEADRPSFDKDHKDVNNLDRWVSFERRQLTNRNVEGVTEKTLTVGEESITCLGGKELKAAMKEFKRESKVPQIEIVSLTCRSDRGLSVMFVSESSDVDFFYGLLPQVRRIS